MKKDIEEYVYKELNYIKNIADATTDAVYLKDIDGKYLYLNHSAERFVGKPASQVLGKDDTFLFPASEAKEVMEGDRRVMEGGKVKTYEETVTGADGKVYTFLSTKGPIFDEKGKVAGIFGASRDINNIKKLEIEKEQFFNFFELSEDIMVIADPNGSFKRVNPACLKMLGYKEEELISKPFVDFIYIDDKQPTLEEMKRQIAKGSSLNFENRYVCKDGSLVLLSWNATYDKITNTTYATARNITKQREMEEKLKNKLSEVDQLNKFMIGRELKMAEMKKEIEGLREKLVTMGSE